MARKRRTGGAGDTARYFSTEDGVHYRGHHQDIGPAIKRVEAIKRAQEIARPYNPTDRRYVGSVPISFIIDWCQKHGYTYDQWARNDGGVPGMRYPESKGGVKDEFMKWFLSRDNSKLHTQHVTTKRESNRIVVPNYIGSKHGTDELRRAEGGDS